MIQEPQIPQIILNIAYELGALVLAGAALWKFAIKKLIETEFKKRLQDHQQALNLTLETHKGEIAKAIALSSTELKAELDKNNLAYNANLSEKLEKYKADLAREISLQSIEKKSELEIREKLKETLLAHHKEAYKVFFTVNNICGKLNHPRNQLPDEEREKLASEADSLIYEARINVFLHEIHLGELTGLYIDFIIALGDQLSYAYWGSDRGRKPKVSEFPTNYLDKAAAKLKEMFAASLGSAQSTAKKEASS